MIIPREHIIHSTNPYVRKCCGCIHLRIGSSISCLIWAGLSLYFAILSFQARSHTPTALYIFGAINLILFGICLGTLLSLYLRSENGIKTSSFMINVILFVFLVDLISNTILFIVKKDVYVQWCSNDSYHCDRMWQNELKFTILITLLITSLYVYWAFCLFSYAVKLRIHIKAAMVKYYQQGMMNNGDIIL